ncbi:MAG: A/G-specific adenine glycosylase [Verrucomicrobia bacterium]|nr:A/G-specific adenine glycosylase [Verrucomicrobiota bacterium]
MQTAEIQKQLLRWFDRHARKLPWRSTTARRNPYRVWVSEIMLQQTQVATVIPYYRRWLRLFPNVRALASARPAAVLKAWEGLGYYRRARNLHAAAREVVRRCGGRLSVSRCELLALPGIGRYTAGAILSIAFGQREPLVDGNVARVLARLFGIRQNVKSGAGLARLWKLAGELVPRKRPGAFNESLMELGATLCTPQNPRCDRCPVRGRCVALRRGEVERLPNTGKHPESRLVRQRALLLWRGDRVLIQQRQAGGLLGDFWEFPSALPVGVHCLPGPRIATVRHAVMNDRLVVEAFDCRWQSGEPNRGHKGERWRWARPADLRRLPFIGAHRKIVNAAIIAWRRSPAAGAASPRRPADRRHANSRSGKERCCGQ